MNNTILNKYDIKFIDEILSNKNVKKMDSPNKYLNQFITDSKTIEEAKDLLDAFNAVINGNAKDLIGISLTLLAIEINNNDTKSLFKFCLIYFLCFFYHLKNRKFQCFFYRYKIQIQNL